MYYEMYYEHASLPTGCDKTCEIYAAGSIPASSDAARAIFISTASTAHGVARVCVRCMCSTHSLYLSWDRDAAIAHLAKESRKATLKLKRNLQSNWTMKSINSYGTIRAAWNEKRRDEKRLRMCTFPFSSMLLNTICKILLFLLNLFYPNILQYSKY